MKPEKMQITWKTRKPDIILEGVVILRRCNTQIREHMCLETHFQNEFSFLGRFGQSGLLLLMLVF